jgi:ectoine hydroxylase-related dioxygenase (phytanoyl-CoA dioxygenase family)
MLDAGGVIIQDFLTPKQVSELDRELDIPLANIQFGSKHESELMQEFHGHHTKRITDIVNHSNVYRNEILDMGLVHDICELAFATYNSAYWMSSGQAIEINPGNSLQILHRDQSQYPFVDLLGPSGPEASINFLIAVTRFTEANGATRVILGSHKWPDFSDRGQPDMTIPAEMNAGDAILLSGKTVHGGGANKTSDERRRGLAFVLALGSLTPEEAYPFQISVDTARTMSKRAQRMVGFRSVYPSKLNGLWQWNSAELAGYIGIDD